MDVEKQVIRQRMIVARRSISQPQKIAANKKIKEAVVARKELAHADLVCVYLSLPEEVDTWGVIRTLWGKGKRIVVPRVAPHRRLALHEVQSFDDVHVQAYGITEPNGRTPFVDPLDIDAFIVPGLAFDRQGYRLGWGKGYFDRLLASIQVPRIGLAFFCQVVKLLPHDSTDIPMTTIITEKGAWSIIKNSSFQRHKAW